MQSAGSWSVRREDRRKKDWLSGASIPAFHRSVPRKKPYNCCVLFLTPPLCPFAPAFTWTPYLVITVFKILLFILQTTLSFVGRLVLTVLSDSMTGSLLAAAAAAAPPSCSALCGCCFSRSYDINLNRLTEWPRGWRTQTCRWLALRLGRS